MLENNNSVLVGLITETQNKEQLGDYLSELSFLAETAGLIPMKQFSQNLICANSKTYVGSGKILEIRNYLYENNINTVIFDEELTPSQIKNIDSIFNGNDNKQKINIVDRTSLILDIFAMRAKTAYAKTQVELAQYQYLLPRLTRMWTHLDRQRGGGGIKMRGTGETQIETDRRIILKKISDLKEELKKIDKQMLQQRKNREQLVRVALVGYTNVGKSTIMNLLSKSNVFAENKLFATLDTTVRKTSINNINFLLSDTVGFIRKLPHNLIESFKSTLDETKEADIIIHVVDVSHKTFLQQINIVEETLKEINANNKNTLMVFNKTDLYDINNNKEENIFVTKENIPLQEELKSTYFAKNNFPSVFISATEKNNLEEFKTILFNLIREIQFKKYPYSNIQIIK